MQVITHLIPQRLQVLSHYLSFYLKFSMKIVISSIVRRPCSFSSRFKTCNFRPVFFKMIKKKRKKDLIDLGVQYLESFLPRVEEI